ncbi:FecR family protein [Sphingobacterium griseoflavum]|nr:FecR domain-containing protein [Sphingobacterium griseoflavum]
MELKNIRTKQLLKQSILHELAEGERDELRELLNTLSQEEQERLYFEACEEAISAHESELLQPFSPTEKEQILVNILNKDHGAQKQRPRRFVYRVYLPYLAACFILSFISIAFLYFRQQKDHIGYDSTQPVAEVNSDINPADERALLTTKDGTSVTLDTLALGEVIRGDNFQILRLSTGELQYQMVRNEDSPQEHMIRTPKGGTISIILPDGTKVWLNAASFLRFNPDMESSDRRVTVEGEVYFEVAKRTTQRFIVSSGAGEIEVLGTKFNVNTYQRNRTEVGLLEGSIRLTTAKTTRRMVPSELAVIRDDGYTQTTRLENIDDIILWKEGLFNFQNATPELLAEELSRWYNVDVTVVDRHAKHRINGKISRNLKLSKMIEMLDFLGFHATYSNQKLIINTKNKEPMR